MWAYNNYTELYHHGILGQKWGIRRFQNPDGSLTSAGRERYGVVDHRPRSTMDKFFFGAKPISVDEKKIKKAVVAGSSVVAAALAVYGGYKLKNYLTRKKAAEIQLRRGRSLIFQLKKKEKEHHYTLSQIRNKEHMRDFDKLFYLKRDVSKRNIELRSNYSKAKKYLKDYKRSVRLAPFLEQVYSAVSSIDRAM